MVNLFLVYLLCTFINIVIIIPAVKIYSWLEEGKNKKINHCKYGNCEKGDICCFSCDDNDICPAKCDKYDELEYAEDCEYLAE